MAKRGRREPDFGTDSGRHRSFGYVIESNPMALLSNQWTQYAKVTRLLRYRKNHPAEDLELPLWEVYGQNPDEALSKARVKIREWIDEQPAQSDDYFPEEGADGR
jgi:hypothetical protein